MYREILQKKRESQSMALDRATLQLSNVGGLAQWLDTLPDEAHSGKPGPKADSGLYEWVEALGAHYLASLTWRAVMSRLRNSETDPPHVTPKRADLAVRKAVEAALTSLAVKEGLKGHDKTTGDRRWTMAQARKLGLIDREYWENTEANNRAHALVDELVERSPHLEVDKSRRPQRIVPTPQGQKMLAVYWAKAWPKNGPSIVRLKPWTATDYRGRVHPAPGGYNYARVGTFPLVKSRSNPDASVPKVRRAVNALQDTPWRVNRDVFDHARRLMDLLERSKRTSAMTELLNRYNRTLDTTEKLGDEVFYLPHNLDFRGRINALPEFSVQGGDLARGLLRFAEPKKLGPEGWRWLALHGANLFGQRGTIEERVAWVLRNSDRLERFAREKRVSRTNPFQRYAFCLEWAAYMEYEREGRGHEFPSSLPCQQDASCNAVQHIAALWRHTGLARRVNLLPGKPHDLYTELAKATEAAMRADDMPALPTEKGPVDLEPVRAWWLAGRGFRIVRGVFKSPIMTMGYGAGLKTLRQSVQDSARDIPWPPEIMIELAQQEFGGGKVDIGPDPLPIPSLFARGWYLTKLLQDVVIPNEAPTLLHARNWLAGVASAIIDRTSQPVEWRVPYTGLQVRQDGWDYWLPKERPGKQKQMKHNRGGILGEVSCNVPDRRKVRVRKQKDSIAANVVHSLDAAALVATVNRLAAKEIDIGTVHDGFFVHAADGAALRDAGRRGFHDVHKDDVLPSLFPGHAIDRRYRGTLDIDEVLKAEYFMS